MRSSINKHKEIFELFSLKVNAVTLSCLIIIDFQDSIRRYESQYENKSYVKVIFFIYICILDIFMHI